MPDLNLRKTVLIDAKASGAIEFDDFREYEELRCTFPNAIFICYGEAIDLIGTCYAQVDFPMHGKYRGNEAHFEFLPGEHIIKITGMIAMYWNKSFIFNLTFHTDMGRDVGIKNQQNGRTVQGKPFTIEFDKGYALACLFGKTASPIEGGKTLPNYSFLSAIGAYQRRIECITQAEFTVYAQGVKAPVAEWMMDHTGVCATVGHYTPSGQWVADTDTYRFGCHGSVPAPEARYIETGHGSLEAAIILACGEPNAKRANNDFITPSDDCGIVYLKDGVCHQMTNRLMSVTGKVFPADKVWCSKYSIWKFGLFGYGWTEWRNSCYSKFDEVYLAEKFEENVSAATLMSSTDDPLTQKLISLEDKGHQLDIAIIERTKVMLEDCFGSNLSKEKTNSLIQVASQQNKSIDLLEEMDEEEKSKVFVEEMKSTLRAFNEILGAEDFKKFFYVSLDEILNK
ncbi:MULTISPECIES: jacalin-like lectin [unclassified Clostridioides]|uniref:jacalin-like lectin n=1 Tax=unclassified Clostridioides TaxID=2635829 RepID=UPI001D121371|nr:hypothetical protein [Clostridioides sp. ES-S-0049-03]MCC0678145.1 hypothetical protein [Clostridioides sp. ES-W-0018-02]MCC0712879.1 hypothetical protein [Clostridioides sp. ES-W-0017-02]